MYGRRIARWESEAEEENRIKVAIKSLVPRDVWVQRNTYRTQYYFQSVTGPQDTFGESQDAESDHSVWASHWQMGVGSMQPRLGPNASATGLLLNLTVQLALLFILLY